MNTKTAFNTLLSLIIIFLSTLFCSAQTRLIHVDTIPYDIYPEVIDFNPNLPSPFITKNGKEFVIAVTNEKKFAIVQVTLSNDHGICPQLTVDTADFPQLAQNGLHSEERLNNIKTITDRSLKEISELGHPNGLSQAGFLAHDENIISVIKGDNRVVSQLGLTHPQLAKPIFHVLNMMDADLSLNRWNMAKHQWENIRYFYYNNHKIFVEAGDTKGGQKSIFNDNVEGAFYIKLWREFDSDEIQYLKKHYDYLPENEFNDLKNHLSVINTGEMEPQYIMRYGFYEGHTYWRTDPIAISFIFGLKNLNELNRLFESKLHKILTSHYTE
ncbi:MAG: hypothetical protein HQ541_21995 [Mariniphaga sp.]|nr:hypothetical protein [Mariniphaga sp.]